MRWVLNFLIIIFLTITPVLAASVTLKTTQDEYTFFTGEEARIPFFVESTFPRTNVGDLAYTLTRKESQGGLSFSQSSSQEQSFPISPGNSQNAITLSSDEPVEYEVSLSIHYRDDGKDFSSDLPPFQVQFINNQTGQNQPLNQNSLQGGNPLTSITREIRLDTPGQMQDPFAEMDEQMNAIRQQNEQMLQQALSGQGVQSGSGRQQQPQNAEQALQNNQMNAQASALQQQLAQETIDKQKETQHLKELVSQDPLINQMTQNLNQAGFQQKEGTITAQRGENGSISADFENQTGQSVHVQGDVKNGSVERVVAVSNESIPVPKTLSEDRKYQDQIDLLRNSGYNQTGGSQSMTLNETRIEENMLRPDGKNATITSIIRNGTVEDIIIKKDEEIPLGWYIGIILLIILTCLCFWAGYRYYQKRNNQSEMDSFGAEEELPDIIDETEKILKIAEASFSDGRIKDAYAFAGQGTRFFISHTYGTGTAGTNEEIIAITQNTRINHQKVVDILNRCMVVEFARSEGNEDEFNEIITSIRTIVREHSSPLQKVKNPTN